MLQVLSARQQEIMEEVLDLLMSFVDFQAFKDLMLAHKLDSGPQHMQVSIHGSLFVIHPDLVTKVSTPRNFYEVLHGLEPAFCAIPFTKQI